MNKTNWDEKVAEANRLNRELQRKPDSEKRGYICTPGGILNAYREGDVTFDDAVKQIEEWAASNLKVKRAYDTPEKPILIVCSSDKDVFENQCQDKVNAGYILWNVGFIPNKIPYWQAIFIRKGVKMVDIERNRIS